MTTFESEIWDDLEEKGYEDEDIEEILEVVMKYVNV
jgi:SOS response regulatory protein OraA/RecX